LEKKILTGLTTRDFAEIAEGMLFTNSRSLRNWSACGGNLVAPVGFVLQILLFNVRSACLLKAHFANKIPVWLLGIFVLLM
jgi:hypothetical protein